MSQPILRFLRLYCATPNSIAQPHRDGILAVAAVNEAAELATLLLADMALWGRGAGASVTNAIDMVMVKAHASLIARFGIPLAVTRVVEWDSSGHFDLYCDMRDGRGYLHHPLVGTNRKTAARSREAFLSWAPGAGQRMLTKAEEVGSGVYAGTEG